MNVIFISATCDRSDYEDICAKRKYPLLDSSQKFFEMFLNGLNRQEDVKIDCISVRPISHGTYPGFYIPSFERHTEHICYRYVPIWNFPLLKSFFAMRSIKRILKMLLKKYKEKNVKIICDPLLLEGLLPTVKLGKRYRVTTAGFLTDMPDYADVCDRHGKIKNILYRAYNRKIKQNLTRLDCHIVLTEAMRIVAGDKPWMLLDCIVDEKMLENVTPKVHEDKLPHVLYAGKLHKEFGLDLLGQAMQLVKHDCIFDLFGDGNYIDELRAIAKMRSNIKIHGIVPLKEVLSEELSASILINPRTSAGEFTKYSFPSKTAEYMLAGVPVIMFRLPGISVEYEKYIQYADEETPESLAEKIDSVLSMCISQREQIGYSGKCFISNNKNNLMQAKRVIEFLR